MPCANIITSPGSTIMCSSTWLLSHCKTKTACFPGTLLHTYFSYNLQKYVEILHKTIKANCYSLNAMEFMTQKILNYVRENIKKTKTFYLF